MTLLMVASLALPPPAFDHVPGRSVTVTDLPAQLIEALCPDDGIVVGCAFTGVGKVFIRDDLTDAARSHVLRHEYGHINGWTHR